MSRGEGLFLYSTPEAVDEASGRPPIVSPVTQGAWHLCRVGLWEILVYGLGGEPVRSWA